MERNISRIAFAVIGYATKALFILFAALFAMLAACLLVCAFTGDGIFAAAAAVASACIAALCWGLRNEIPVKMEGR